ncbi:hypothetical protein NE237_014584 [Protea cynaroides]|uniref:Zinc finger protein CONSTANS-LIKE 13 n=1 Tax=Protea cynaroides TaxID=273540 RepID=A0A9Q0KCA3_9MAGN|nr:hypothetical protein NE237_014584 [Protea cynaroides]
MADSAIPRRREEQEMMGDDEGILVVAGEEEEETKLEQNDRTHKRLCDYCGESLAILYCRADTAKLCFLCDHEVHSGNLLFKKHTRSQLCDACDSSPASIFCSTENLVLCQNCDWDTHGQSLSLLHDRRPLDGFSGCPSVTEFSSILGLEDIGDKSLLPMEEKADGSLVGSGIYGSMGGMLDELSDAFAWEAPPVVNLDDLILFSHSSHNFQATGNPPLPKNRNTTCGRHKEDILSQLRRLAKLEHCLKIDGGHVESLIRVEPQMEEPNIQYLNVDNLDAKFEHDHEQIVVPGYKGNAIRWHSNSCKSVCSEPVPFISLESHAEESLLFHEKPAEVGGSGCHNNGGFKEQMKHPVVRESLRGLPKFGPRELTGQERDSMISRYKEKRKTRRFDKHIRYESRKARAESRTRIRGRFAKVDH